MTAPQTLTQAERTAISDRAMLDAAIELVLEHGTEKTTLAMIGEKAGYSRGLATYRFGSKAGLYDESEAHAPHRRATQGAILYALDTLLRLMHPFCPYITEDIWQALPKREGAPVSIMIAAFPKADARWANAQATAGMELAIAMTQAIRQIRSETNVNPSITIEEVFLYLPEGVKEHALEVSASYVRRHARVEKMTVVKPSTEVPDGVATAVVSNIEIRIPLKGLIDVDEERQRLQKELGKIEEDIAFVNRKLTNEKFVGRAPEHIVAKEREKLASYLHAKEALTSSLADLEALG